MEKRYSRLIKYFLALILVITLIFAINWMRWKPIDFNQIEWLKAKQQHHYRVCYKMRESVIDKLSREKPSWDRLIAMLGKPDYQVTQIVWRYKLTAPWYKIFPDEEFILIMIENGTVVNASLNKG